MSGSKIQISADGLKRTKPREWAIRFFFGGCVSLGAGLIAKECGPVLGGLFLGFPSILPATLTLVKKHKGRKEAADEAWGAAMGATALIVFALLITLTVKSWGLILSLIGATLAWGLASLAVWYVMKKLLWE